MRVLIVNSVCGIGSTGRICTDIYDELVQLGHECCIAYGRESCDPKYHTYKLSNKLDNYWHVFETRTMANHGFASRNTTKKFVQFIKEYNPDVIHLHNIHGYYLNVKILFDYLSEYAGKIVWTFHDQWAYSPQEAYIFDDPSDKTRFSEYPQTYFTFRNQLKRKEHVFSQLSQEKTIIVTPSSWLRQSVEASFLPYPVQVINNGIDLTNFYPREANELIQKYNLENKRIILGCTNIWETRKGLSYFIELAEKLKEYQVVIIGQVEEKLPDAILHISRTDSVEELAQWYSISEVFFNPTQMENFPTVNIEALACGTPILTFGKGGSGEVVDKNVGRVVQDIDEACSILKVTDFKAMRTACVEKSKYYSSSRMVNDYIKLYSK